MPVATLRRELNPLAWWILVLSAVVVLVAIAGTLIIGADLGAFSR